MLSHYIKVAFRYLARHKGYAFINVFGLSVGITCCILVMLFAKSEWSFDRFHSKSERLYRAWLEEHYQGELFRNIATPVSLVPVLQQAIPEIEDALRIYNLNTSVRYNNALYNDNVSFADSNFLDVFDFQLVQGDRKNPLPTANSLLLTETMAKRYFGGRPALGNNLELELGGEKELFTVSGVLRDLPVESTIQLQLVVPFSKTDRIISKAAASSWTNVIVSSYFLLKEGVDAEVVNKKIATVLDPLVAKNYKHGEYVVRMQPLSDIHFNSTLPDTIDKPSDPRYAYILSVTGILVLLIACINFVTLAVARSSSRAMEVGVRKVLGAERRQLIGQFWGEAFILTLAAFVVAFGLTLLLQKPFNQLANRELFLSADFSTLLFFVALLVVIGLLAGIYPALFLSGFRPIEVLKGKLKSGDGVNLFRKALITGQFVASILMIIGTLSVGKQLDYMRSKDLGFNKEHMIVVQTNKPRRDGNKLAALLKSEIQKNPEVLGVTTSLYSMAEPGWMNLGFTDDNKAFRSFKFNAIDAAFIPVMDLEVIAGRNFSAITPTDSNHILVNETLVKEYGWKDPIGKRLPGKIQYEVLGVVKDFNIESLHNAVSPAVLALKPDSLFSWTSDVTYDISPRPRLSVRFRSGNLQSHIQFLESAWKSVTDEDFTYDFLDESLEAAYVQETRLATIVRYAAFLSIFIACMGLFGLTTLIVVRRTKEIGVRKVLGSSNAQIVALLSKDFVMLVVLASAIAFPIGWWAISSWLKDFAYRIDVPVTLFAASALLALAVALVTVSLQAIKAALMNPVKSLRTE